MQALRQAYKTYQEQVYAKKATFPTSAKALKSVKSAEQQLQRMQNVNDFSTYDETVFYKQKFETLYDFTSKYEKKKMAKQPYIEQVRALLAKDYAGMSIVQSRMVDTKGGNGNNNDQLIVQSQPRQQKGKSPLKEFFDSQEVKNSGKVTFSNLLAVEDTPLKYGLKSTLRSRSPANQPNLNDNEIRRLRDQNERMRSQLDSDRSVTLNVNNDDHFRELRSQIGQLSEQNRKLKSQVQSRVGSKSDVVVEEDYEPYNIKIRPNNIMHINSRNFNMSEKSSQMSEYMPRQANGSRVYYDNQEELLARSNFTHNPQYYANNQRSVTNVIPPSEQQLLMNTSHSTIQTQFLNLEQEELNNEEKNHVCREKIAFFKKSMVLYKGEHFDIAYKRSDLNVEFDRLRVILYVNNKDNKRVDCVVEYDYEREDYDLTVRRRMERVEARGQGREEIEIYLRNASDFGSLITAKVLVGSVMKKIVIPALFIDFDSNYRLQFENIGYIERNLAAPLTIKPMGQFATLQNASNILELTRDYQQGKYPVGKLYGKSKVTKGVVRLTWNGDRLRIETCEEWRTLMGYLFLNAEETIEY